MNIAEHIERGAKFFPHKAALIFEGKSFTYKQLNELVNRAANGLQGLGVKRGDRVALFLPNIPEFVISYLGILKIGAIAVSISAMLKCDEVRLILNDCEAKVVITTESLSRQVPDAELAYLEHILIAESEANKRSSLEEMMANASPEARAIKMERHEPAAILYTSGTTGFPKGATLSHGNVISNIYAKNRCCKMQPEDRLLLYLPLFHCFGQNAILNSAFNACATIVLQRRFVPAEILSAIARERITMFFGVPTVFIKLLELHPSECDFSSVRYYFSASAPMSAEIVQKWQSIHNLVIHEGYGLTETSPFACYNHELKYKLGSIGMPIENVEMQAIDRDGKEVAPGVVGELVIRGPNVMLGYWNRPVETAQVLKNGWFHTGDLGWMDDDGYFYIVDRLKDMINVSGFKVYPNEVERVLATHPAVAEVAVYGVPDPVKGEIVKANILLKSGQWLVAEDAIAFCSERIAAYKVPHLIQFVDSLPKNATGKVLKRLLRESHTQPSQHQVQKVKTLPVFEAASLLQAPLLTSE
jgi:long-chain acyl-CoA synthetase